MYFLFIFSKTLKTYLLVRAGFLFLVRFFDIIHNTWSNSYLSFSYFYSMYCCNAQLIISPWKLCNINSQFLILSLSLLLLLLLILLLLFIITKGRGGLLCFSPLSHLWYFSFCPKEMMPATQGKVMTKKSKVELIYFFLLLVNNFCGRNKIDKGKSRS